MTKESFKHQVLGIAYEANQLALNRPAIRVVADLFSVLYHVLDEQDYETIDRVFRKNFPEYYRSDGRTKIDMNHYKQQLNPRGGYFITKMSGEEIEALYSPDYHSPKK